jgi:hypothetical protein
MPAEGILSIAIEVEFLGVKAKGMEPGGDHR